VIALSRSIGFFATNVKDITLHNVSVLKDRTLDDSNYLDGYKGREPFIGTYYESVNQLPRWQDSLHTVTFCKVIAIDYVVFGRLQCHRLLGRESLLLWLIDCV
jgi:hypothetical protein